MNLLLQTDSYKIGGHWDMTPKGLEVTYSYLESRGGAKYARTVFFGLQYLILKYLSKPITAADIDEAEELCGFHLGSKDTFNRKGWEHILKHHDGYLPLRIKAVPEGTVVPTGNVLMTVENTDDECAWLTNYMETLLSRIWYSCTVATLSYFTKETLKEALEGCSDNGTAGLLFMLHDFGARSVTCEQAGIGGAAHLVNFLGTDTIEGMVFARDYYHGNLANLAFSVPATEHSVMTPYGPDGEKDFLLRLINQYPTGVLSVVADSFNIERFVREYVREFKDEILARTENAIGVCKFVIRPDSLRGEHDTPENQMVWLTKEIDDIFGHEVNSKGYKVINPKVGLLWGDGINHDGIEKILHAVMLAGYSVDHLVFGMGGGLLQRVNRDTQRFAFKCSAQVRDGEVVTVQKNPLDKTKKSKGGFLKLVKEHRVDSEGQKVGWDYKTINHKHPLYHDMQDEMVLVFENGVSCSGQSFDEIRENALK